MTTTVEILDRIEPLAPEWERLARETGAKPFLWPGWIQACWNMLGRGRLQIFTVRNADGRLDGVLPLRRFRGVLRSITVSESSLFGPLATDEASEEKLMRAALSQHALRVELSFLDPRGVSSLLAGAAVGTGYRVEATSVRVAPRVAIEETSWDAFEARLRRKFRSELRRRRRLLTDEGRLTLEVYDGRERLRELLDEGFRVEGSGWKGAYGTSINLHPGLHDFYTEVARWAVANGWLRLAFLKLDGRALAFDYGLEHSGVHYLLKTGYDPAFARYAPGMILRHMMLERAFAEGLSTYDFCGPDFAWKREWSDTVEERLFVHMFAPTTLGRLDRATFVHVSPVLKRAKRSSLGDLLKRGRGLARRKLGATG